MLEKDIPDELAEKIFIMLLNRTVPKELFAN